MKKSLAIVLFLLMAIACNAQIWTTFNERVLYDSLAEETKKSVDSLAQVYNVDTKYLVDELNIKNAIDNLVHAPTVLVNVDRWYTNSAGGLELYLNIMNCSLKTIKYVDLKCYFNNAVGDPCYNTIGGNKICSLSLVGPIDPRPVKDEGSSVALDKFAKCQSSYSIDDSGYYNKTANTMHFTSVTVKYMDGTVRTFRGKALDNIISFEQNWDKSNFNPLNCIDYLAD